MFLSEVEDLCRVYNTNSISILMAYWITTNFGKKFRKFGQDRFSRKDRYFHMVETEGPLRKARRKILCKRFSTKSRMVLESRADSGLNPLITESHGGQNGMRADAA